ncbi:hypothetical protein D9613_007595 [Agrocybe pediades]|uniref:Mediator of RNA polymerase II transcription subunit 22 n=1 Tax=Agrocybe pediades TaxID=84607 RepID=A0A8H4QMA8_9AGAR|nr:hypothetical protein D9613_007595 [Agrocybe pediades]
MQDSKVDDDALDPVAKSDVSRPSALPTGRLQQRNVNFVDQSSVEYLDTNEEEWNKKLDSEVEILVDGMVDLVSLASIGDKDKFRVAQESFQAIRAANSLLSITHSLKLLLLLSDEAQIVHRRDAELKLVQEEREDAKAKVAVLLDELLRKAPATNGASTSAATAASSQDAEVKKEETSDMQ